MIQNKPNSETGTRCAVEARDKKVLNFSVFSRTRGFPDLKAYASSKKYVPLSVMVFILHFNCYVVVRDLETNRCISSSDFSCPCFSLMFNALPCSAFPRFGQAGDDRFVSCFYTVAARVLGCAWFKILFLMFVQCSAAGGVDPGAESKICAFADTIAQPVLTFCLCVALRSLSKKKSCGRP